LGQITSFYTKPFSLSFFTIPIGTDRKLTSLITQEQREATGPPVSD